MPETPRFGHRLHVPRGWERQPAAANGPGSCVLSTHTNAAYRDAAIRVTVTLLQREANPVDLVENELFAAGFEIVEKRAADGPAGAVADLLCRRTHDGETIFQRTTMAKDGSTLYRVDCSASEQDYPALAEQFLVTLASFELTEPTNRTVAEEMESFRYVDPCPFLFPYPASWSLVPQLLTRQLVSIRLDNPSGDACAGRLYVDVAARNSASRSATPQRLLGNVISGAAGVEVTLPADRAIERKAVSGLDSTFEAVVPVEVGGRTLEFRALLALGDKVEVDLCVVGPTRGSSPDWWAVNKRAYEIVRDRLSVIS